MARRIEFKVSQVELEAIAKFANDVGVTIEHLAKLSLFYAMRKAYTPPASSTTSIPGALTNEFTDPNGPPPAIEGRTQDSSTGTPEG